MIEEEKITSIEVKTALIFWHNFILLSTTFLFGAGLVVTFNPKNLLYSIIIYALSLLAGYLLSGIATSKAKIKIEEGKIIIEQENSFIKRGVDTIIELKDLRGFEVGQVTTRYDTSLVLYKKDFSVHRYILENKSHTESLKNFLAQYIPLLDAKANPNYNSFSKAFWFALKNISILFLFTILIWIILTCFIDLKKIKLVSISFSILLLFWHLVTKNSLRKNYFRFSATYSLVLFFPFIAIGLSIPAVNNISELIKKPAFINAPKDIFVHTNENFFYIKNILASADKIISSYKIGSRSGKSSTFRVTHYIETRVTDIDSIFNNIWLRKEFKQNIDKSISFEEQTSLINEFQIKAKNEFANLLSKRAIFYKAITIKTTKFPLAVLEPHWESLNTYKNNVQRKLAFLIGGIIISLLIGSGIISFNR